MQKPASKDRCAASLVRASAASAALRFKKCWHCFAGLALSRTAIDAMPTAASATAKIGIICNPTRQPPIFALGLPGPLWTIVVSTAAAERRAAHQDAVVLSACSRTTSAAPAPEASRQPGKYAWSFQKKPGAVSRPGAMNAGHNMKAPYCTAVHEVTAAATIHPPTQRTRNSRSSAVK